MTGLGISTSLQALQQEDFGQSSTNDHGSVAPESRERKDKDARITAEHKETPPEVVAFMAL